jgi:DNA-binding NarL/FixJ family response regulator
VFEAARAQLLQAEVDSSETAALQQAHSTFTLLGADQLRRRTATLLKQRKVKVPRRRRRQPGVLTDAEASIARLVQLGMRNRDIAAALHYSERTVEVYLSRIYATLGVTSRLQLARLLDEPDRGGSPSGPMGDRSAGAPAD